MLKFSFHRCRNDMRKRRFPALFSSNLVFVLFMHIMSLQLTIVAFLFGHFYVNYFKENKNICLSSTGLDPAGLRFEKRNARDRLDAAHASFVDVIHTDTRSLTLNHLTKIPIPAVLFKLGTNKRLGDSDFYPNDGYHQSGCKKITLGKHLLFLFLI